MSDKAEIKKTNKGNISFGGSTSDSEALQSSLDTARPESAPIFNDTSTTLSKIQPQRGTEHKSTHSQKTNMTTESLLYDTTTIVPPLAPDGNNGWKATSFT